MFQRLTLISLLVLASSAPAFAGIIGVGGSNSLTGQDMVDKVNNAEEVAVKSEVYQRINTRLSTQDSVNVEINNNQNQKERADFIKVYINNEPSIVESNFRMKLIKK